MQMSLCEKISKPEVVYLSYTKIVRDVF